jgi:hypothetical protein
MGVLKPSGNGLYLLLPQAKAAPKTPYGFLT